MPPVPSEAERPTYRHVMFRLRCRIFHREHVGRVTVGLPDSEGPLEESFCTLCRVWWVSC